MHSAGKSAGESLSRFWRKEGEVFLYGRDHGLRGDGKSYEIDAIVNSGPDAVQRF